MANSLNILKSEELIESCLSMDVSRCLKGLGGWLDSLLM